MKNTSICYSDLILLSNDVVENVKQLMEWGAEQVELLMDGPQWDEMENLFKELVPRLRAFPVSYSIHPPAWDLNLTSENCATRETAFFEYKKAIQFANQLGASHVVIHPGFCFAPFFDKKQAQLRAKTYITELSRFAKELNVKLAIENVGYNGSSLFTQMEYTSFLEEIDDSTVYLIDTGHAHLNHWDIPQLIMDTKDRLFALHIHDNNGIGDDHLPIGEGSIEWAPIYQAIHQYAPNCQFILEYATDTPLSKLAVGKKILQQEIIGKSLG